MEATQPVELVRTMSMDEKKLKLTDVVKMVRESQGKISLFQYENIMQPLFDFVPELEAIQKNARLRVLTRSASTL